MQDLKALQEELDVKKWYDSVKQHRDMCGEYSYCAYCNDMYVDEPCAKAYLIEEAHKEKPQPPRPRKTKAQPVAEQPAIEKPAKKAAPRKGTKKAAPADEAAAADAPKPKRTRTKKSAE